MILYENIHIIMWPHDQASHRQQNTRQYIINGALKRDAGSLQKEKKSFVHNHNQIPNNLSNMNFFIRT